MSSNYDVIVIGAGSIGVPTALFLAEKKICTLVIDRNPSPGQGENKSAIGGVRATHSDKAKIKTGQRSIDLFSTWKEKYGDDIDWLTGGYMFPVYSDDIEQSLKDLLVVQKSYGLNINWIEREEMLELVPGLNPEGLRGGTYSPEDGHANPLLSLNAFYRRSVELGADYKFNEVFVEPIKEGDKVIGVTTDKGNYYCETVINASGAYGKEVGDAFGVELPVVPDSHEGGITEPVKRFFDPMVVDIRPERGSKNYYFYQNPEGKIIFCITPEPPIVGKNRLSTSVFLPQVAKRMIGLMPRLRNIKIRRTWRGLYPMTPDGSPIISLHDGVKGYISAVGMCGQGFMLGPGIGELLTRLITNNLTEDDWDILKGFSIKREFSSVETLK